MYAVTIINEIEIVDIFFLAPKVSLGPERRDNC